MSLSQPFRKQSLVVLIALLAVVGLALAPGMVVAEDSDDNPPLPAAYYGEVTVDGEPADGVTITAEIDGEERGSIVADDGEYGGPGTLDEKLTVEGEDGEDGETIEFFVNGEPADTDPSDVEYEPGVSEQVDLEAEAVEDDDDDDDDDDDTGTGGAAPAPDDDVADDADDTDDVADDADEPEESIEDTRETVDQSEPDVDTERDIEDADPDTPGVTVDTSDETSTVESVSFADEETTGSVSVREYSDESVVESTGSSLSSQLDQDVQSVGSVADITVSDNEGEPAADTAATVTMGIDADDVENPDDVVINHETDDGWEQLETSVEEETDDRVRVSGDVDGFSLFAVAEVSPAEDDEPVEDDPVEDPDDGIGTTGLIGLIVVLALVVAAAVAYRQMNSGDGDSGL